MADTTTDKGNLRAAIVGAVISAIIGPWLTAKHFNTKIEEHFTPKQEVIQEYTSNEEVNILREENKKLREELERLKKNTPAPSPGEHSTTVSKVEITVEGCKKLGSKVTCFLSYLNKDAEDKAKDILLYASNVKMYDQNGDVYTAEKHAMGENLESYKNQGYVITKVIHNNPSKVTVMFDVGDDEVSKIAHLEIYTGLAGGSAELYNIAFDNQ